MACSKNKSCNCGCSKTPYGGHPKTPLTYNYGGYKQMAVGGLSGSQNLDYVSQYNSTNPYDYGYGNFESKAIDPREGTTNEEFKDVLRTGVQLVVDPIIGAVTTVGNAYGAGAATGQLSQLGEGLKLGERDKKELANRRKLGAVGNMAGSAAAGILVSTVGGNPVGGITSGISSISGQLNRFGTNEEERNKLKAIGQGIGTAAGLVGSALNAASTPTMGPATDSVVPDMEIPGQINISQDGILSSKKGGNLYRTSDNKFMDGNEEISKEEFLKRVNLYYKGGPVKKQTGGPILKEEGKLRVQAFDEGRKRAAEFINSKLKPETLANGGYSETGYLPDSPDRFNPSNKINSNIITMKGGIPFPIYGRDALGNETIMVPGETYVFEQGPVTEIPLGSYIAQNGGPYIKYQQAGPVTKEESKDFPNLLPEAVVTAEKNPTAVPMPMYYSQTDNIPSFNYPYIEKDIARQKIEDSALKQISKDTGFSTTYIRKQAKERKKFNENRRPPDRIKQNNNPDSGPSDISIREYQQYGPDTPYRYWIKGPYNPKIHGPLGVYEPAEENFLEFVDPTGILSWDDASEAIKRLEEKGFNWETNPGAISDVLDIIGAIPAIGKVGKVFKFAVPKVVKEIQEGLNYIDTLEDLQQNILDKYPTAKEDISRFLKDFAEEFKKNYDNYEKFRENPIKKGFGGSFVKHQNAESIEREKNKSLPPLWEAVPGIYPAQEIAPAVNTAVTLPATNRIKSDVNFLKTAEEISKKTGTPREQVIAQMNMSPAIQQEAERVAAITGEKPDPYQARKNLELNIRPAFIFNPDNPETAKRLEAYRNRYGIDISDPSFLERWSEPISQLQYLVQEGSLPNRAQMQSQEYGNVYEGAMSMWNPVSYVNSAVNAGSNIAEGNYGMAALDALGAIPGYYGFKAMKPIAKGLNQGANQLGKFVKGPRVVESPFSSVNIKENLLNEGLGQDPYYHFGRFMDKSDEIISSLKTTEGRTRIQNYINENPHLQSFTVDDIIKDLEKIKFETKSPYYRSGYYPHFEEQVDEYIRQGRLDPNAKYQIALADPNNPIEFDLNTDLQGNPLRYDVDPNNAYNWYRDWYNNPSYMSMGQNFTPYDALHVLEHEWAHAFQRGAPIKGVDDVLGEIELLDNFEDIPLKEKIKRFIPTRKSRDAGYSETARLYGTTGISKTQGLKLQKEYYKTGSRGQEKSAFAAEIRENLLRRGLIKNRYDEITPEILRKHYNLYKNTIGDKYNLRLYDIMENKKRNFSLLSKALNRMPALAPYAIPTGIGIGTGINKLQEQKHGGNFIKHQNAEPIQRGGSNQNTTIANSKINTSYEGMKSLGYPVYSTPFDFYERNKNIQTYIPENEIPVVGGGDRGKKTEAYNTQLFNYIGPSDSTWEDNSTSTYFTYCKGEQCTARANRAISGLYFGSGKSFYENPDDTKKDLKADFSTPKGTPPTEEQKKRYDYFIGDYEFGSLDAWDIVPQALKASPKNVLYSNIIEIKGDREKAEKEYEKSALTPEEVWKKYDIPIGSFINLGKHSRPDVVAGSHTVRVVGYTDSGEPLVADYGKVVPLSKNTIGYDTVAGIVSIPGKEKYTYKWFEKQAEEASKPNTTSYISNLDDKKFSEEFKKFHSSLVNDKNKLKVKLGIDGDQYDQYSKIALTLAGTETEFGNSLLYRVMDWGESTGITQLNKENVIDKYKDTLSQYEEGTPEYEAVATLLYVKELDKYKEKWTDLGKKNRERPYYRTDEESYKNIIRDFQGRKQQGYINSDDLERDVFRYEKGEITLPYHLIWQSDEEYKKEVNEFLKEKAPDLRFDIDDKGRKVIYKKTKGNSQDIENNLEDFIFYAWQSPNSVVYGDAQGDSNYYKKAKKIYNDLFSIQKAYGGNFVKHQAAQPLKYGGGLRRWFKEEWKDIRTGEPCGRSSAKGDSDRPYPYCRPSKRVNKDTPKTSGEMTSEEKRKKIKEKASKPNSGKAPTRVTPLTRKK